MALVTLIPLGQALVQLKAVLHLKAPLTSFMISSLCFEPWSRESITNLCAFTIAAGPIYVVSCPEILGSLSYKPRIECILLCLRTFLLSSGDCSLSLSPGSSSLIKKWHNLSCSYQKMASYLRLSLSALEGPLWALSLLGCLLPLPEPDTQACFLHLLTIASEPQTPCAQDFLK